MNPRTWTPAEDRVRERFSSLLLGYRARTRLTQRELAARVGVIARSIHDWETGLNRPGAPRLQALIAVLLAAGGMTAGRERQEAQQLWQAVMRESPRMRTSFDDEWFTRLAAQHAAALASDPSRQETPRFAAAGDARAGSTKQLVSAAGEGATAALMIRQFLQHTSEARPAAETLARDSAAMVP